MNIEIFPDTLSVASAAASFIARESRAAIAARGRFVLALSGGSTPWLMLRCLAREEMQWDAMQIVQVDERVAPAGDPERNLTHLYEHLLKNTPIQRDQILAMRVEDDDLQMAAAQYAQAISKFAGSPPVLDLVHLGLGIDGHTASLVPRDAVLGITEADVAVTGTYQNRRRMTLAYPILNRSRQVLWLVTGEEKAEMLHRLRDGDHSIPAGRILQDRATIFADLAAAGGETA